MRKQTKIRFLPRGSFTKTILAVFEEWSILSQYQGWPFNSYQLSSRICSSLFSIAMHDIDHEQKQLVEVWVPVTLQVSVYRGGKLRQELKAGVWRQAGNQKPWKNAASWLVLQTHSQLPFFLLLSRTTCSGLAPPTVGCAPAHPCLLKEKNAPTDLSMGQSGGIILSTEPPSSLFSGDPSLW